MLYDVLDAQSHYGALEGCERVSREDLDSILDAAARFSEQELFPCNRVGDEVGCKLRRGSVVTAPGFKEAFELYRQAGWAGMIGDPEYGGQGLPSSIRLLAGESMSSANMAWTMYPDLSLSAMHALDIHGTPEQKQLFLTRLLAGEWTGTMCLTEPQAGSDVGLLTTKATPRADGRYSITGTKIFISAGDHDLAPNILHLVLARVPDAPAGTRGISLFIVPKYHVKANGEPGKRNGVVCSSIEKKMGLHGNATCVLNFENAVGYRVGEENQGMRCMFTMMNSARLGVGVQGLGIMEMAYQISLPYAQERLQMRSLRGPQNPDAIADPIIVHADVRRMLLTQKAFLEGGRALAYYAAMKADVALHGAADEQAAAEEVLSFLTPIVKAFLTETGFESANHALQIFGGHGFIRETGIEQYVRDSRITLLYEGTTQIQALDLLARKVLMTGGKALLVFIEEIKAFAQTASPQIPELAARLDDIADDWGGLAMSIGGRAAVDPDAIGAASVDFLMYSGYAALAYFWVRIALAAKQSEHADTDPFLIGKLATAQFYMDRILPRAEAHKRSAQSGANSLMAIDAAAFSHH
ncbi:MAG: acyl-CoA dehydrogenase [Gammaproteobacteria bacterium]|nr:acyl-CoA dehydrogenase [Gammaproteobacteria bacterium]